MLNPIKTDAQVTFDGQPFYVRAINVDFQDIYLRGKGGIERTVDYREFYNGLASGLIQIPGYSPSPTLSVNLPSEYAEGIFRRELVRLIETKRYLAADAAARLELLEGLATKHKKKVPSQKTLLIYQKKHAQGGLEALIPNFRARGGSGWSSKSSLKEIARRVILDTYAKDDKINITSLSVLVNAQVLRELGTSAPVMGVSRRTISRLVHELPRDIVLSGRVDVRTYRLASRQAVRTFDAEHAFQVVEIDAKTIDMYVVDEFGERYSQITMYAMVCSRTSYPVGIYISAGAPSEYTLLKLFEFFFSPKDQQFKDRFQIQSDWPMPCGIATALLDNGAENAGAVALEIVRDLGIEIHYARVCRGDDKPHVESFFNVLEERVFMRMPGAKESSDPLVTNRHERAESEACYSIEDVYRAVIQFVANVYVREPREKLGFRYRKKVSISQAMDEELRRFMPPPPPSLFQIQRLVLQKHKAVRKVQHYGIDYEGFQYHSYEFSQLALERTLSTVEVFFNPSECKSVFVSHPDTGELIELFNRMRDVPNVSFEQAKALRKEYGKNGDSMTGHDYQRTYAAMLAKWTQDSGRAPKKIRDNNRSARQRARTDAHDDVKHQLAKRVKAPPKPVVLVDADDDFEPAPRGKL